MEQKKPAQKPRATKKRPRGPTQKELKATLQQLHIAALEATAEAEKAFQWNRCTSDFLMRPPTMHLKDVGPYIESARQFITRMDIAMQTRTALFEMIRTATWGTGGGHPPYGGAIYFLQPTERWRKPLFRKLLEELTDLIWYELRTAGYALLDECATPEEFVELKTNLADLKAFKERAAELLLEDQALADAADAFCKNVE